jgi:hypothetical protein
LDAYIGVHYAWQFGGNYKNNGISANFVIKIKHSHKIPLFIHEFPCYNHGFKGWIPDSIGRYGVRMTRISS